MYTCFFAIRNLQNKLQNANPSLKTLTTELGLGLWPILFLPILPYSVKCDLLFSFPMQSIQTSLQAELLLLLKYVLSPNSSLSLVLIWNNWELYQYIRKELSEFSGILINATSFSLWILQWVLVFPEQLCNLSSIAHTLFLRMVNKL